ncbi:MAG: HD domain-containing phosphohydrolase, partial [Chloroflexota bacterium]
ASEPSAQDIVAGVEAGCNDFLLKPVDKDVLLPTVRSLLRTKQPTNNMVVDIEDVLTTLSRASELKEGYSKSHVDRVAAYALFLGEALGLSFEERAALRRGALLHDIGKLGISESILLKKGPLDVEERGEINLHPSLGESICRPLGQGKSVLDVVRHHHERFDGKGYPDGLKGDSIPLLARVTAIADAYDAMTNHRPYRDKLPHSRALDIVREEAGGQFDPNLALTFCNLMRPG